MGLKPDLGGKRVLIAAGTRDPIAPIDSSKELSKKLGSLGAEVELIAIEAGHEITRGMLRP